MPKIKTIIIYVFEIIGIFIAYTFLVDTDLNMEAAIRRPAATTNPAPRAAESGQLHF